MIRAEEEPVAVQGGVHKLRFVMTETNHPKLEGQKVVWEPEAQALDEILLIRQAIPTRWAQDLVQLSLSHGQEFVPSTVVRGDTDEGYVDAARSSRRFSLSQHGNSLDVLFFDLLFHSIEPLLVETYRRLVNPHAFSAGRVKGQAQGTGWEVLRYGVGDQFKEHVDVVRGHGDKTLAQRQLSMVCFANRVRKGGQLHFPRQGLTLEPEPGMMALFPSGFTHPHASLPVLEGFKLSVVSWFI